MNAYAKYFGDTKCMNLLVHDKEILKKYNEIWNKIKSLFKKELNSEPVYNDKYIKTQVSLYNINFYGNKMPKENECYTCLCVILLDSIFVNSDNKYYPEIILNECKYEIKKVINTITENLKLDESDRESDNEFDKYQNICDGLH